MRNRIWAALLAVSLLGGCSAATTREVTHSASKETHQVVSTVSDEVGALKVKSALMASSRLDSSQISVEKRKGIFHLTGSVTSAGEKQVASRIAQDTAGNGESVVPFPFPWDDPRTRKLAARTSTRAWAQGGPHTTQNQGG